MSRLLVPAGGFAALAVLSFTLLVVIILRPWAGPDNGWRTHMNQTDEAISGYTRSVQTFVSPAGAAPILVWRSADCGAGHSGSVARAAETGTVDASTCGGDAADGTAEWVGHGCANCHGLEGAGGIVGPNLLQTRGEKFNEKIRFGATGMPAFDPVDLTDEHIALIADYLAAMRIANPELSIPPTPTPTPVPTPTPPAPAGAAPATPSSSPAVAADSEVLALGKLVFEEKAGGVGCAECHGLDGKGQGRRGGESAPDIRGMSRSQVREALKGAFDMSDIKLTNDELMAVIAYLQVLRDQSQ